MQDLLDSNAIPPLLSCLDADHKDVLFDILDLLILAYSASTRDQVCVCASLYYRDVFSPTTEYTVCW